MHFLLSRQKSYSILGSFCLAQSCEVSVELFNNYCYKLLQASWI